MLRLIDQKVVAINFIIEIELFSWRLITPALETMILDIVKAVHYFNYSYRVKQRTILIRQNAI